MRRYKRIWFVRIMDIWFEENRFYDLERKSGIVCLHTNRILDKTEYDFKLTGKTFLLDIEKTEEEIFTGFEYKSCRYPINKAYRDGIRVWKAESISDKMKYLAFQNAFCIERGIPKVDENECGELDIYCAETVEKEFGGGCAFICSIDQTTARYKYGATTHKLNTNEAILWKAICDYHKRGFTVFDFGGCVPTENKESYYYSHYHFKKKFGGELADSYSYFKIRGIYRLFYYLFMGGIKLFFDGDVNAFIVWLNRKGFLR